MVTWSWGTQLFHLLVIHIQPHYIPSTESVQLGNYVPFKNILNFCLWLFHLIWPTIYGNGWMPLYPLCMYVLNGREGTCCHKGHIRAKSLECNWQTTSVLNNFARKTVPSSPGSPSLVEQSSSSGPSGEFEQSRVFQAYFDIWCLTC